MATLFGSKTRTDVLVAIARLDLTYPTEVARVLSLRLIEVQRAISSLERSGAVVSRRVGNTRTVSLNPRFRAADELYTLLLKLSEDPWYEDRWAKLRKRPRAIGKQS